jgi:predicted MFS family arabinose efflux permease
MGRAYPDIGDRQGSEPRQAVVVTALGITQIFAWGCSYYLPAVLAKPITAGTGWPLAWVVGGLSLGLVAAGLSSPVVGRAIQDYGGRSVLAISSILLATGLVGVGLSQNIATYLAGWIVIGFGMGAGLYDPAFATLGRIYRERARSSITMLTLFGGFSSTICWPLSWWLVQTTGWRCTCLIYAGLQLVMSLPIYLMLLPSVANPKAEATETTAQASAIPVRKKTIILFGLLAAAITFSAVIQATMSIHLLNILEKRGVGLATAVVLGAVVGPSQVLARVVEMIVGRRFHPIWTMVTSTVLVACGLGLLSLDLPVIAVALVLHGAGMGIMSIARGTVPLALFGVPGYAVLMGRLAAPSLLAQAISPLLAAEILESAGATGVLLALCGVALANVVLAAILALCATKSQSFSVRDTPVPASSNR